MLYPPCTCITKHGWAMAHGGDLKHVNSPQTNPTHTELLCYNSLLHLQTPEYPPSSIQVAKLLLILIELDCVFLDNLNSMKSNSFPVPWHSAFPLPPMHSPVSERWILPLAFPFACWSTFCLTEGKKIKRQETYAEILLSCLHSTEILL